MCGKLNDKGRGCGEGLCRELKSNSPVGNWLYRASVPFGQRRCDDDDRIETLYGSQTSAKTRTTTSTKMLKKDSDDGGENHKTIKVTSGTLKTQHRHNHTTQSHGKR